MTDPIANIDLKIRNATKEQWPIVADMIRANIGILNRTGIGHGSGVHRGDIYAYMYLTKSGKAVVAYVEEIAR